MQWSIHTSSTRVTPVPSVVEEFQIHSNIKHCSSLLAIFQCFVIVALTRNLSSGSPDVELAQ